MRKLLLLLWLGLFMGCNPVAIEYPLIYTNETPNPQFASKLKEVLEDTYNVNIRLVETNMVTAVLDSLDSGTIDMGLMENFVEPREDIKVVVPVYPKILHLFHERGVEVNSMEELFYDKHVYIGQEGTASYTFMMKFWDFYNLDPSRIDVSSTMTDSCQVLALFSVLMDDEMIKGFSNYELFSLDADGNADDGSPVRGLTIQNPRIKPFVIPQGTYGDFTNQPIVTISTDMLYVVREGMGWVAVNDLIHSIFDNRERFIHLHPSFFDGIKEDFDRSTLGFPLHPGAKSYLNRDEPSFFERYAELAGVIFSIILAIVSGIISLSRWRKQSKKDKIDEFYGSILEIKTQTETMVSIPDARNFIRQIKSEQDRAFNMLIKEELIADESFRIYMELAKETIRDLQLKIKVLKLKGKVA